MSKQTKGFILFGCLLILLARALFGQEFEEAFFLPIFLLVVLVLLAVTCISYINEKQIKRKTHEKRQVELGHVAGLMDQIARQKKELSEVYDELKLEKERIEIQTLQAIMNPHFVSNCLSCIQNFISGNDVMKASLYLSEFGKLLQINIDQCDKKFVPLKKELEQVKSYILIEKIRTDHPWEYVIHIDEKIDVPNTTIPPMFIQPFIENSIWYGIKEKKEGGEITISLDWVDEETLKCSVEDNGVRVMDNKMDPPLKALKVVEKRLQGIWKNRELNHPALFTDIKTTQGIPVGSRVEFHVPTDF